MLFLLLQLFGVFLIGFVGGYGFFLGKKVCDMLFEAIANHVKK